MMQGDLRQRFNVGLAVLLFLAGILALFLAMPLDGLNLNPVVVQLHDDAKAALALLSPYLLVAALGAGVGLAELTSTFSDYPREALATRWGQYLIWLNALAAGLAFFVVRSYAPRETNIILLIIAVGAGFPALIRTKFTLAKQFGGAGNGDLNVNIGWLYEQFQNLCKKQIDLELMTYRRSQVDRLLTRYPTVQELYQTALYTIKARATLTKQEEEARLEELQETIDPKVPPELARMNLGLLILELGGVSFVDLLVSARAAMMARPPSASTMAPGAPSQEASAEGVVRQLMALPLAELVTLATGVLGAADDRAWIQRAAAPEAGVSEVRQKAPIAYYLVDRAGAEAALQALRRSTTPGGS